MRVIKYVPCVTSANTEYRDISEEDMSWVREQMIRYLARMGEVDAQHEGDLYDINKEYWHRRRKTLPRGRFGPNTPCSFISGLVNNLIFGTQRNFTDKQMAGLEDVSHVMSICFPEEFQGIRFKIGFDNDVLP